MKTPSDGSIHALGSGNICAYGRTADIIQIFGPPYSAPDLGSLVVDPALALNVISHREPLTAIWTHELPQALLTDFSLADPSVLVRQVSAREPLSFDLHLNPAARVAYRTGESRLTIEIPAGTFFYAHYPYPRPVFYLVGWSGNITVQPSSSGVVRVDCTPGESTLFFCGGPEYPQAVESLETALSQPNLLSSSRAAWLSFSQARPNWSERLSFDLPLRTDLLQAIDDVSILIRAQQSREGGVIAGHNYHLCYVRDQYGVSRGLLALGHIAQAEAILEYYWQIWQRHGRICNAQAAGVDAVFHIHENDEVEITGYLILQAFDLELAGREGIVERIFPMLAWAWEAQKKHLIAGMLPFNGDETYVAGGILPRTTLNDGSAEATLLFIESGEKLLNWIKQRKHLPLDWLEREYDLLARVRSAYKPNFWRAGRLITNNPTRVQHAGAQPRFRHGVCERCHAEGRMRAIGWTERSSSGRYLCPHCLADSAYDSAAPRTYEIQSVGLTPLYFGSEIIQASELRPAVEEIFHSYLVTGRLPSRPDSAHGLSVGYDYGFLLHALTRLDHPGARDLYIQTLSLRDSCGAWVEYYIDHLPQGTRCRPWESGINIEALLAYALHAAIPDEKKTG